MSGFDPPRPAVRDAVARALAEDLLPLGDLSSVVLPVATVEAVFVSRSEGILAGRACATETYGQLDPSVALDWFLVDGDPLEPGTAIATVSGPIASVLSGERTALNFMGHLSGIATAVGEVVEAASRSGDAGVWDTRKTTPGLRALEKAAVRAGGGRNHRGNLSEWVMIKDNHLMHTSITVAVAKARDAWPGRTVHVECDRFEQAIEAVAAGADALLLDNMAPEQVSRTVKVVREASTRPCLIEASGGITIETVAAYAATGVDMVSSGALTNSASVVDIGLDMGGT